MKGFINVMQNDVLDGLKKIEDDSVQCVVTSPPYWGLRDYGVDGQLGLEETPEEYVSKLVKIFREMRRVLADDGTFWLNLGDSYAGSGGAHKKHHDNPGISKSAKRSGVSGTPDKEIGLKAKDLVMIPHRVALALQDDNWWIRNDIVWRKNGMPESVTDRCTNTKEYIFLLTKSKQYYYDHESISEPSKYSGDNKGGRTNSINSNTGETKNKRDVWKINTKPFSDAHFAVFPPELPQTCIKAGTEEGDTVLDPFMGAGTTGMVAKRLKRNFIGIDINKEYCEMAKERINKYEWGQGFEEKREIPDKLKWLTTVDGVGRKTALNIWDDLNKNFGNVVNSIKDGSIQNVSGVGPKTHRQILESLFNESY